MSLDKLTIDRINGDLEAIARKLAFLYALNLKNPTSDTIDALAVNMVAMFYLNDYLHTNGVVSDFTSNEATALASGKFKDSLLSSQTLCDRLSRECGNIPYLPQLSYLTTELLTFNDVLTWLEKKTGIKMTPAQSTWGGKLSQAIQQAEARRDILGDILRVERKANSSRPAASQKDLTKLQEKIDLLGEFLQQSKAVINNPNATLAKQTLKSWSEQTSHRNELKTKLEALGDHREGWKPWSAKSGSIVQELLKHKP